MNLSDLDPMVRWALLLGVILVAAAVAMVMLEWSKPR